MHLGPHHHVPDSDPPPGELVSAMVDQLAGLLARLTDDLAWDSPTLVVPMHLDAASDDLGDLEADCGDAWALRWSSGAGTVLPGHPFTALIGRHLDPEAVGALLVVEGWLDPGDRTAAGTSADAADACTLDADADSHRGPDGRAEVRTVTVALRDGTTSARVLVRGGSWHALAGTLDGRVPAALARYVGRPSTLTPPDPEEVARRAWMARGLELALAVEDTALDGLPAPIREAAAALGVQRPGDLALYALATAELRATMLPAEWEWLATHAGDATGWDDVLERARTSLPAGSVGRLVIAGSNLPPHTEVPDQADALAWCDGAMLGTWFDEAVPSDSDLEVVVHHLRTRAAISLSPDEVRSLSRVATGTT